MKYERQFNVKFTYDEIVEEFGFDLPLNEWGMFCECFSEYFRSEYANTIEWMKEEWDELKEDYIDDDE